MTTPTPAPARRVPVWLIITLAIVAAIIVATASAVLLSSAIIGAGARTAANPGEAVERDLAMQEADPAGGIACNSLDSWHVGVGTAERALQQAGYASTPAIRDATTTDELWAACEAAGANMSPR